MKWFISLLILVIFNAGYVSAQIQPDYKKISIQIDSDEDLERIAGLGIDLDDGALTKEQELLLFVTNEELSDLAAAGFSYEVLIDDWFAYYNSLPKMDEGAIEQALLESELEYNVTHWEYGSMGGYYTYAEAILELDSMYMLYPNLITQKTSIGTSHEGRTIWMVKVSDNPNVSENEPQVMFDGLIHAREAITVEVAIYYLWYLLENYGTDPEVTYLLDNREIFIVPVFNPDGYEYNRQTNPNGGGMWRKNRRNNGGSYGVDLNRNFGYMWGYDNTGSSGTPSSETYRGPSAFSEPEPQSIRNFVNGQQIRTHINMHSYSNVIIYPWGYINALTPDSSTYKEFASQMSSYNGYPYGNSTQTLGSPSNGTMRDWMYGDQTEKGKIFSYVFEIGSYSDNFWPPQYRILPLIQENIKPLLFNTWVAGEYIDVESYDFIGDPLPNNTLDMAITLKNRGLSSGYNIEAELVSLTPHITIVNSSITADSVEARSTFTPVNTFSFSIAYEAPFAVELPLQLTTYTNGSPMTIDTVYVTVGKQIYALRDTMNNPATLWTLTSSPSSSPDWEATTSTFVTPPNSYTDSKNGNYVNNATVTMTLTNPLTLNSGGAYKLGYYTSFNIESNWDYGQVEISTNGGGLWTPLTGSYTEPGQGSFQPGGEPVYDGTSPGWVKEEIDISAYAGNQVLLRFQLRSDGGITADGWYLDDIGVFTYNGLAFAGLSNDTLISGQTEQIQWRSLNVDSVLLAYSTNSGSSWNDIATVSAADESYDWEIPYNGTDDCIVRVSASDGSIVLLSETFTIIEALSITAPAAGTILYAGQKAFITWTNNANIENVTIRYANTGPGWTTIATVPADDESYEWIVPDDPDDFTIIEISDVDNPNSVAVSDPFTIEGIPDHPIPVAPADNAVDQPLEIEFVWELSKTLRSLKNSGLPETANVFWFELSVDSLFSTAVVLDSTLTDTVTTVAGLDYQSTYFWRVRTTIGGAWSGFGPVYRFTTLPQPVSAPTSLLAVCLVAGEVELSWTDESANETGFIIERKDTEAGSPAEFNVIDSTDADITSYTDASVGDSVHLYTYRVKAFNEFTESAYSNVDTVTTLTNINDPLSGIPSEYALHQNYPNPFNPSTVIRYSIPEAAEVTITVYDVLGNEIAEPVNGYHSAGNYEVQFDASQLSSGIYFYRISANKFNSLRKMLLLK